MFRANIISLLKKIIFTFIIGINLIIAVSSAPIDEETPISIDITGFNYGGHLNLSDLFMIGQRHHTWLQTGLFPNLAGGIGYRYLMRQQHPQHDVFLGIYFQAINNTQEHTIIREKGTDVAFKSRSKYKVGGEVGLGRYQATLNGYVSYPLVVNEKDQIRDYREGKYGGSLRLSTYFNQKISKWGRWNPFVFIASTKVRTVEDGYA